MHDDGRGVSQEQRGPTTAGCFSYTLTFPHGFAVYLIRQVGDCGYCEGRSMANGGVERGRVQGSGQLEDRKGGPSASASCQSAQRGRCG